jgi:cyclopropane-fatty-acyl-phospholipid synthase
MAGLVTSFLTSARSYASSIAWDPLVQLSRASILALLKGIQVGQLTVKEKDDVETVCGNAVLARTEVPVTSLKVVRDVFWLRLALFADMVSSELTSGVA